MENASQFLMPEKVRKIAYITQYLANGLKKFYDYLNPMFAHIELQSSLFHQALSQIPTLIISPEIIFIITTTIMVIIKNQNSIVAIFAFISIVPSRSNI